MSNNNFAAILLILLVIAMISFIFMSYQLYAYDFIGNAGTFASIASFIIQYVMNIAVVALFLLIRSRINND